MQFNILGSLEVTDGARPVALGGFKQRAALAVLVLDANKVVAIDRLVDELWGEQPPREATNTLQTYISTLRRALEPDRAPRAPARILRSQPPGYLLAVDPANIDATRFEQLTGEGRALLRAGQHQAARDRLAQALGLWRGPALVEFADERFARSEAARLEELRLMCLEDRIAADLALGEHGAVIGELQRLTAAESLREALWHHLILALYRAGRQADALAAYQSCRRTLDEQLGIEPGAPLRQLELDVLQQAPSLDWQPSPATAPEAHAVDQAEARALERGLPFLIYRDGDDRVRVRELEPADSPLTVGREAGTGLRLAWDALVSRIHARLEHHGDEWILIDDGPSRNGSFVNDERIVGRRALRDGDVLRFGDTQITYRQPMEPPPIETQLAT